MPNLFKQYGQGDHQFKNEDQHIKYLLQSLQRVGDNINKLKQSKGQDRDDYMEGLLPDEAYERKRLGDTKYIEGLESRLSSALKEWSDLKKELSDLRNMNNFSCSR